MTQVRRKIGWGMAGLAAAVLLAALLPTLSGCGKPKSKAGGKKVVVIGFDGMDPRLMQRMVDQGRMPHFKALMDKGGFWKLGTSIPPQSPVAWSNFITGADPGAHGIFDFVHREPAKQADADSPYFSANRTDEGDRPTIWLDHAIPMPWQKQGEVVLTRGGTPFWDYLDARGIPSNMFRVPANYPPSRSQHGHTCCLTDMGTPDVFGTQGTCQWFSPDFDEHGTEDPGGVMTLPMMETEDGRWLCKIKGAANPILVEWITDEETGQRVKDASGEDEFTHPETTLDLFIEPDRANNVARLSYTNYGPLGILTTAEEFILKEGEWSDWQKLVFPTARLDLNGGFPAIARFLLKRLNPYPELYVSPINFDPERPMARISEPEDFVTDIGKAVGPFYTQGFAEAFKAMDADVTDIFGDTVRLFDAEDYRVQSQTVLDERKMLLQYALDTYEDGLLFFYFSSTDLIAHMFWWAPDLDELPATVKHPTRADADAAKYQKVMEGVYEQCDESLGKVVQAVGDDATILVMSDHGFGPFYRKVNLNTWLYQNGYITLKKNAPATGDLEKIADWSKTKAYSIGLNGIYLNMQGRERDGSVTAQERDALLDEIATKLQAARDTDTGDPVVYKTYRTDRVYHGPYAPGGELSAYTPDLIVGYHKGYITRTGTMGSITKKWLYDNNSEWSADHCVAAELVPGILVSNRRIAVDDPDLKDLAPTILGLFDVKTPDVMTGRDLFQPRQTRTASARE